MTPVGIISDHLVMFSSKRHLLKTGGGDITSHGVFESFLFRPTQQSSFVLEVKEASASAFSCEATPEGGQASASAACDHPEGGKPPPLSASIDVEMHALDLQQPSYQQSRNSSPTTTHGSACLLLPVPRPPPGRPWVVPVIQAVPRYG